MNWAFEHPWIRRVLLFAAMFIVLCVFHHGSLRSPPTPDQILGVWTEGSYLAQSHFDYAKLFWEEPPASRGGPRTYMFSAVPTILAVLMTLFNDPQKVLLAYHLFCIGCAATALILLFELLLPISGAPAGLLTTVAAATTPLFSVQIAIAGMETPLVACSMLAAFYASKNRFLAAAAACVAAFFVKSNALVLLVANLGCVLLRLYGVAGSNREEASKRRLYASAAVNGVLIVVLGAVHVAWVLK